MSQAQNLRPRLAAAVHEALCPSGADPAAASALVDLAWATCESKYSEQVRKYHNLGHLEALFKALSEACAWQQEQLHGGMHGHGRAQQPYHTAPASSHAKQQHQHQEHEHQQRQEPDHESGGQQQLLQRDMMQQESRQRLQAHMCRLPTAVVLAVFYHDIIYDPARPDNEEMSAELANEQLQGAGVSSTVRGRLSTCTKRLYSKRGADVSQNVLHGAQ